MYINDGQTFRSIDTKFVSEKKIPDRLPIGGTIHSNLRNKFFNKRGGFETELEIVFGIKMYTRSHKHTELKGKQTRLPSVIIIERRVNSL